MPQVPTRAQLEKTSRAALFQLRQDIDLILAADAALEVGRSKLLTKKETLEAELREIEREIAGLEAELAGGRSQQRMVNE